MAHETVDVARCTIRFVVGPKIDAKGLDWRTQLAYDSSANVDGLLRETADEQCGEGTQRHDMCAERRVQWYLILRQYEGSKTSDMRQNVADARDLVIGGCTESQFRTRTELPRKLSANMNWRKLVMALAAMLEGLRAVMLPRVIVSMT